MQSNDPNERKLLYHISRRLYSPGEVPELVGGENEFTRTIRAEGREWVEIALERHRPLHRIKRSMVRYAFDNPAACIRFARGESRQRGRGFGWDWHLYEVTMPSPSQHPIGLVDRIHRLGKDENDERMLPLIQEYWHPTASWKRYEYLDREMMIVGEVADPDEDLIAGDHYKATLDLDLCQELWPSLYNAGSRQ